MEARANEKPIRKQPPRTKADISYLEKLLLDQLKAAKLPLPERHYQFAAPRRWEFDFAWPEFKLYVEVEGGTWGRQVVCNHCEGKVSRYSRKTGRRIPVREGLGHTSGEHFAKNLEKYNAAVFRGWRGLRFTTDVVRDGSAVQTLGAFFKLVKDRDPVTQSEPVQLCLIANNARG